MTMGSVKMSRTKRDEQKEQTKRLLLQTAREVFAVRGITNTRMSDIAQAAGVSHGTVFLHFSTQEALITEVVENFGGELAARTHRLADSKAGLRAVLRAHLESIGADEAFYTRLVTEGRLLPQAVRDSWVGIQSAVSLHFSEAAADEIASARVKNIPPSLLFNTWAGLLHYYLSNSDLFAPQGGIITRYGDTLINHYMSLVISHGANEGI